MSTVKYQPNNVSILCLPHKCLLKAGYVHYKDRFTVNNLPHLCGEPREQMGGGGGKPCNPQLSVNFTYIDQISGSFSYSSYRVSVFTIAHNLNFGNTLEIKLQRRSIVSISHSDVKHQCWVSSFCLEGVNVVIKCNWNLVLILRVLIPNFRECSHLDTFFNYITFFWLPNTKPCT